MVLLLALCASQEPRRLTTDVRRSEPASIDRVSSMDHQPRTEHPFSPKSGECPHVPLVEACTCLSPSWSDRELSTSLPVFGYGQPPVHMAPPVGWVGAKE
uniref:Uncharacterized protein n=1 Tax=Schizaphis graminum TaxID=13262 RepID=A0A2S2PQA3_SCHGA